jgi:hypothetical protein
MHLPIRAYRAHCDDAADPPTTTVRIEDVQAAFSWIRRELVTHGCAADDQAAGSLEARLDDIELDVVGSLTNRARVTRTA